MYTLLLSLFLLQVPPASSPSPSALPPDHPPLMQPPALGEGQVPPSHPPLGGLGAEERPRRFADLPDVVSRLDETEGLREAPKTFEIAASIALEYARASRFEEAAFYYGQAWEKAAEVRVAWEELKAVKASSEACEGVDADKELALEFAKAQKKKPEAKQAACVRLFLPKLAETGRQLAVFQMLSKNMEGAKKTWEALLGFEEVFLEASYALGVLLLETEGDNLASLERARGLLQAVVGKAHPRANLAKGFLLRVEAALEAGGNSKVQRPRAKPFRPEGLSLPEAS